MGQKIELLPGDESILSCLSLNGRATQSQIADDLGCSRQVVKYSMDKMDKMKVIEGYYAILNIFKLGYHLFRILFRFQKITPEKENQIIKYFSNHKNVGWVCQYYGEWDLAVSMWTKGVFEFENIMEEALHRFGKYVETKQISITTKILYLPHHFLADSKNNSGEYAVEGEIVEFPLGDIDYNILGILTKSGRTSISEISKLLKLNQKIVNNRVSQLIEKGIILGFNVKINHHLLGYSQYKIFLNFTNFSKAGMNRLIDYLRSLPNAICITKAMGVADLEFELMVKGNKEFHQIMKQVRFQFPNMIQSYSSIIVSYEPYINYLPEKK